MPRSELVHIVASSSVDRAEQASACYALGYHAEIYGNFDELLAVAPEQGLVLAEDQPERGGVAGLIARMAEEGFWLPVVATAHQPDPSRVVDAIKAGALDYIALPFRPDCLARTLARAFGEAEVHAHVQRQACTARKRIARLTQREREVLDRLVGGLSNKCIARDLAISPRTVEIHRAHMMSKLGATHAADAVRIRLEADWTSTSVVPFAEPPRIAA